MKEEQQDITKIGEILKSTQDSFLNKFAGFFNRRNKMLSDFRKRLEALRIKEIKRKYDGK